MERKQKTLDISILSDYRVPACREESEPFARPTSRRNKWEIKVTVFGSSLLLAPELDSRINFYTEREELSNEYCLHPRYCLTQPGLLSVSWKDHRASKAIPDFQVKRLLIPWHHPVNVVFLSCCSGVCVISTIVSSVAERTGFFKTVLNPSFQRGLGEVAVRPLLKPECFPSERKTQCVVWWSGVCIITSFACGCWDCSKHGWSHDVAGRVRAGFQPKLDGP